MMSVSRKDALMAMLQENPANTFARYGLAMEYANGGDYESAVREYEGVLQHNPDYAAAYYHGGRSLERMGKIDEAREMYERGLECCRRTGDAHTASELQAALDIL